MSTRMKRALWIIGTIIVVLAVLSGVAYLALKPRPLKPPETVGSLAELERYLEGLAGHNPDSPREPGFGDPNEDHASSRN